MPDFVLVEHDPFAQDNVQLTPVDYNPFSTKERNNTIESNLFDAAKHRYHLASQGVENAPDPNEPNSKGINRLFGLQGEERYQTFPEKTIRSIYDAMYDPSLDPSHGVQPPSETVIEGAFNAAGLAGGAPLGMRAGTASLGSGMVRPIMNANKNEVPAFYSAVENAVNGINQPKMTGQQWLGTLANKPGVKPEEMGWTGLDNFLKENADKSLTKQEVQDFIKGNKVELKEVTKDNSKDADLINPDSPSFDPDKLQRTSATKYQSYQLPGGSKLQRDVINVA